MSANIGDSEKSSPTCLESKSDMSKEKPEKLGLVADGIYRRKGGMLFERPWIDGKRTWRSLETKNLKLAKEELHRRKSGVTKRHESDVTCGEVIRAYKDDNCPDDQRQIRPEITLEKELRYCGNLLPFWDHIQVEDVTHATCDRYCDWRVAKIKKKQKRREGTRAVDLDLNTLSNAFRWAVRNELVDQNPVADRPLYHSSEKVRHCRETMPRNADDLHKLVGHIMDRRSNSIATGFQALVEALTGLRTCEALRLRTDAKENEPGWITPDKKNLCVRRVKKQHSVNPFCPITPALRAVLDAHAEWKDLHHPNSAWYFPSPDDDSKPLGSTTLARTLLRIGTSVLGYKVTSHGMRAGYVLIRRSWGATDSQIAAELGHKTGGSTVEKVYGGVPENWVKGGPKLSWEPTGAVAWAARQKAGWKCPKVEAAQEPLEKAA